MSIKKIKSDLSIEQKLLLPTKTVQRALVIDNSGEVVHSSVTETELGYLSGVTSSVLHANSSVTALSDVTDAGSGAIITAAERSKLDGIEASADVTDATNVEAAGAVMESDTTTASMSFVIDQDDMADNSDTKVPTQQSVKAYVDAQVSAAIAGGAAYAGGYDASAAPSSTASIGDMFSVTVAGNGAGFFATQTLEVGDMIIAEVTNPASEADWTVVQKNLEAATETSAGYIEIATIAEVDGGTDNTRAITPAGLAASALQTKVNGIEAGADVTDATNVEAAGAVMETDTSTIAMQFVIDEDTMASNLDTKVPTQQSVKAYVDSQAHDAVTLNAGATTQEAASLAGQEITLNQATITTDGVMSSEDKTKLDGIEAGANLGANTTLSNLAVTTAANSSISPNAVDSHDLGTSALPWRYVYSEGYSIPDGLGAILGRLHNNSGSNVTLESNPSSSVSTKSVNLRTGNNSGTGGTGQISIDTGSALDTQTGSVAIRTGDTSTSQRSGDIQLDTGNGASGSGLIALRSGSTAGTSNTGQVIINTGNHTGTLGTSGSIVISSGSKNNSFQASGQVFISTGAQLSNAKSGQLTLSTGNATGNLSGDISIATGTGTARGSIILDTDINKAKLAAQPDGLDDLSIATTKYVNDKIAAAPSGSAGDIDETSQVLADAQAVAAPVPSLAFAVGTVRSFKCQVSIERGATFEVYELTGIQKSASWEMAQESLGDDCGITFTITAAGQVEYTSTATGAAPTVKFRATTTTV